MKHQLTFVLLLVLFCNFSFSQKTEESLYVAQKNMVENAFRYSKKSKSIDSLQQVLNSNKITDPGLYAYAHSLKAELLSKMYCHPNDKVAKNGRIDSKIVSEILESYKIAIDSAEVCKLPYQANRMKFLKNINDTTAVYKSDFKALKEKGYQQEYGSLDFGINYMRGKVNWLGGDVSLITFNGERWKSKTEADKNFIPKDVPVKMGFLNVSYLRNLTNSDYDLSFSLLQLTSPFVLNITKFGYLKSEDTGLKYWYYRPEIGVGWGCFSIYYSYNFKLTNDSPPVSEKHLLNLRIAVPIVKWKFN